MPTHPDAMAHVKMYTTQVCPFCIRAKALLKQRGVEAIEERARSELGMIRQDEIFFQLLEAPPAAAPREPAAR